MALPGPDGLKRSTVQLAISGDLAFKGGDRRVDRSELTLKAITPEAQRLEFALLVMLPPIGTRSGGTKKRRKHGDEKA